MLGVFKNSYLINILPILKVNLYNNEISFLIQTYLLKNILTVLKNHISYQYKILTCISGVDCPNNFYRFFIVYELLSMKYNSRIRVKIFVDELTPLNSIEMIYPGAFWWECEIWDMFGVYFFGKTETVRLLTDYGFYGYPLRKDFPLSGYIELKYSAVKNRVLYENIELAQEYRTFDFLSPWDDTPK